jgi:hypothetical protein
MMPKLVLDENISPAICLALWEHDIDNYHVRDRDRLRISDPRLFARAQSEGRAIATINTSDFERLARKADTHAGVLSIPSGGTRSMQFDYIMRGLDFLLAENAILPDITDRFVYVSPEGGVTAATIRRPKPPQVRIIPLSS